MPPIVRVLVTGRWSNQAYCGCGWFARERMFAYRAVEDAMRHSTDTGHSLADLLVEYIQFPTLF